MHTLSLDAMHDNGAGALTRVLFLDHLGYELATGFARVDAELPRLLHKLVEADCAADTTRHCRGRIRSWKIQQHYQPQCTHS